MLQHYINNIRIIPYLQKYLMSTTWCITKAGVISFPLWGISSYNDNENNAADFKALSRSSRFIHCMVVVSAEVVPAKDAADRLTWEGNQQWLVDSPHKVSVMQSFLASYCRAEQPVEQMLGMPVTRNTKTFTRRHFSSAQVIIVASHNAFVISTAINCDIIIRT